MVIITQNNKGPLAELLDEVDKSRVRLEHLLPFTDHLYMLLTERCRRFVSAWGACGQKHGDWGHDMTNVV